MICKYCNAEIGDEASVCPVCGKELLAEETAAQQIQETAPAEEEIQELTAEQPVEECTEEAAEESTEEAAEESTEEAAEESTEETAEETVEESGEEITEEQIPQEPVKKKSVGKTVAIVVACVLAAAVVVGAVLYALGISLRPKTNEVLYKASYTVDHQQAVAAAETVVAKVGHRELRSSELQVHYWYGVNNFVSYYGGYLEMLGLDLNQPLDAQVYNEENGMTWQHMLLEKTLDNWHHYAALAMEAEEQGYTMDPATQEQIDAMPKQMEDLAVLYGYENVEEMIWADFGSGCTVKGYQDYLATNMLGMDYYDDRYNAMQPTDEEIQAFFAERESEYANSGVTKDSGKYVDVRHILIKPQGGTADESGTVTYSDQEWEDCRQQAQEILDQWLAGEATEESFAQLATEYSEDPGSASVGGLYEDVYVGQMVEPFEQWCFDETRQYGDTGLVQTNYGYHVMYFVNSEDIWYSTARMDLIAELTQQMLQELMEKWPMEIAYENIVLGEPYIPAEETEQTTAPTGNAG